MKILKQKIRPNDPLNRLLAWSCGLGKFGRTDDGTYGFVAAAVIGAGTAIYSGSQSAKAGKAAAKGQKAASDAQLAFYQNQASQREAALKDLIKGGTFEFPTVDAGIAADKALATTTRNLPGVLANTATAYDSAAQNFKRYLSDAFGKNAEGQPAFDALQSETGNVVLDQLKGRLAEGTRTLLGRRALATGATSLGTGAVQDAFTYQLGLAAEDQVQKGITNYQNLYQTYGRFAPQISPLDMLNFGGLTTNSSLQNEQFNAQGEFNAGIAEANAILGNIDMTTQTVGSAIGPAAGAQFLPQIAGFQANADMGQQIGSALAGIAGTYTSLKLNQNSLAQTGYRYNTDLGQTLNVYSEGAPLNRSLLPSNYYLGQTEVRRALPAGGGGTFAGTGGNSTTGLLSQIARLLRPNY